MQKQVCFSVLLVSGSKIDENKTWLDFLKWISSLLTHKAKKKNTLVSGNAGDEKNLHPGSRKFKFLINLTEFYQ